MALTKVTGSVIKDSVSLSGNVSVGGTLTYQDVTNVDALGIGTFRTGINVSGGQIDVGSNIKLGNAGVITATSFVGNIGGTPTFSGDITIPDKIIHTGDTNTAIRFPAADTFSVETAGNERFRIDSSGQMGLGTNNPVQQAGRGLHINGTDQTRIKLTNSNSGATANDGFDIIQENDSEIHIINHENAAIKFGTNATERLRIDSSGRVLIGTQTQFGDGNDKLMIENGTTGGRLTFGSSAGFAEPIIGQMSAYWADNKKVAAISFFGGGDSTNKDDGTIRFATSSANNIAERLRIDSNGHVLPATNNAYDLGSTSKGWRNVYMNDLNLSNMNGDTNDVDGTQGSWTIQEGKDDLYIINRLNGKKFKIKMEEIS